MCYFYANPKEGPSRIAERGSRPHIYNEMGSNG